VKNFLSRKQVSAALLKKITFVMAAAILASALVAGCGGGGGTPQSSLTARTGGIVLNFPDSNAARSAAKIPDDTATISISITNSGLSSPISQSVAYPVSGAVTIGDIPAGVTTITVTALCSEGLTLATRTQKVTIIAGTYTNMTVTLGFTAGTSSISPSSITLTPGDALVIKNNSSSTLTTYAMNGSDYCGGMSYSLGEQGQLKCYPTVSGSYTITAGSATANATVESGSIDSLKAGISANTTFGTSTLYVTLYGNYSAPSSNTATETYSWNLGGGSVYSGSSGGLTSQSLTAEFTSAGDYLVTLTVTKGSETAQDTIRITVEAAPAPTISEISPTSFSNSASATLYIYGSNFQSGATVKIGTTTLDSATVSSPSIIVATIDSGFTAGTYSITVTNPDGRSGSISSALTVSGSTGGGGSTTVPTTSCPPSGDYWFAGIGGGATYIYSFTGTITISGLTGSYSYVEGDSVADSDNTSLTGSATITANSDGTYTLEDGSTILSNNDCSFIAGAAVQTGEWDGMFFARKGSSTDYSGSSAEGNWYGVVLKYEKASGYRTVVAGEYVLSGGSISGTAYFINNMYSTEQTLDVSTQNITYTYDNTTGAVTVNGDTATFTGGVTPDGNTVLLGTSSTDMQAVMILTRKPASFTFTDTYGEWRGVYADMVSGGGETCTHAMYMDATNTNITGRCHDSIYGTSVTSDVYSTPNIASDFSSNYDGSALGTFVTPNPRMYIGEGEDFMLMGHTGAASYKGFTVLFKTDQSASTGQPPTASAGTDQAATTGNLVTLDGTSSSDPDGSSLTYYWSQSSGTTVSLSSTTSSQPTFTPSSADTYVFSLVVDDGTLLSATDTVTVTVTSSAVTPRVSAGSSHSCGVDTSGAVKCWGYNGNGQIGDGTTAIATTATQVNGLTSGAIHVGAGNTHSCAVMSGGTVQCWGDNTYGQLGNGTTTNSPTPVSVTGLGGAATKVVAGYYHSCALLSDGTVECWGGNSYGELGNGSTTSSTSPVAVTGVSGATDISVGCSQNCVLMSGGTVMCWGRNDMGQVKGSGDTTSPVTTAVTVSGVSNAISVGAGVGWTCAGISGGNTKCWGTTNSYGQFGNGTTTGSATTTDGDTSGFTYIEFSSGEGHTCGVISSGVGYCAGSGTMGQLGNGASANSSTVVGVDTTSVGAMSFAYISAGGYHTCAVNTVGGFYCWGDNSVNQLGDGTSVSSSNVPVAVSGI